MLEINNESTLVGVIGLGYVGLPLIDAFQRAGFATLGFDVDSRKVEQLLEGQSYIAHVPSKKIQAWCDSGRFDATSDMNRMKEADALLICVPTPLTKSRDPDLQYVINTTHDIAKSLRHGQLIVLESTTYPGTTRELMLPILEETGLRAGVDFHLAYSPEREDPGNKEFSAYSIPKVIGGYDEASLRRANALYSAAVSKTVPVSSLEIAEACKILENTYRGVNIAMVNEMKVLFQAMDIDIWEVIEAAKTKPFGFQAFYPGPGLGGHCIPIDPFYLSWLARRYEIPTKFIELSGEINHSMPLYVVHRIAEALNDVGKPIRGSHIGILGIAYKKDIDDPRESPSFKLIELLEERGANLTYSDPHIPKLPKMRSFCVPDLSSQAITERYLRSLDCVVIATDHTLFDYEFIVANSQLVIDTRNATKGILGGKIVKA